MNSQLQTRGSKNWNKCRFDSFYRFFVNKCQNKPEHFDTVCLASGRISSLLQSYTATILESMDLRSFEIRFESAIRLDAIQKGLANLKIFELNRIGRACHLLVVSLVKRLKPLTALSGTVYRLASSMSDHTPAV